MKLQSSLDQFSKDLTHIMKVSELDQRLIKEIKHILVSDVSIVSLDPKDNVFSLSGADNSERVQAELEREYDESVLYELKWQAGFGYAKIGERGGITRWLVVKIKDPLSPEEEMWVNTLVRIAGFMYDNFAVADDLTVQLESVSLEQAPSWLLRLIFHMTEKERFSLSQDLHDSVLQLQLFWIRKLRTLAESYEDVNVLPLRLQEISSGLLDVVYQIRLMCTKLSPPFLQEFGLVASLEGLFETVQKQADYEIIFEASQFDAALDEDQTLGLYRIVQELLANALKHAKADKVTIVLTNDHDFLEMNYSDNGSGFAVENALGWNHTGIYGIKQRIRSLRGDIEFHSGHAGGLRVLLKLPLNSVSIEPQTEV